MAIFGLTEDGFHLKRFTDIVAELKLSYRADFGDDAVTDPAYSLRAKEIYIHAERYASIWELAQAVHDSAYPDGAEGINLDGVSDLTGTDRLSATYSTVTGTATGTPATVIPAGSIIAVDATGDRFDTLADGTIGGGGTVDIDCQAQQSGAVQANANSLTVIITPISGWTSFTNASDADVGQPIETDALLRLRRLRDLQVVGAAAVDAIRARLVDDVDGVTDALVNENDDIVVVGGLQPKSIHCVVAGGTDQDIADKIWEVKAGGIYTNGAVVKTVVDSQGQNQTVRFDRATPVDVWMHVQISVGSDFVQGSKQSDVVEVKTQVDETYSVIINGVTYSYAAVGKTKTEIASALIALIVAHNPAWSPVNATASGPADEFINLECDYKGNNYEVSASATGAGDIEVLSGSHVDATGDSLAIIQDIIDFAEGTDILPKEQTISRDVYRSRYYTPINETPNIFTVSITTADTSTPTGAPPGGAGWSAADVTIDSDEVADFDTLHTSVEIV